MLPDPSAERVVPKIDAVKEKYEQKKAVEGRAKGRKQREKKEAKKEGGDVRQYFGQDDSNEHEKRPSTGKITSLSLFWNLDITAYPCHIRNFC